MPGIFGIVDSRGQTDLRELAEHMRSAMNHEAGYVSECFVQDGVALGHVALGRGTSRNQPVFLSDGSHFGVLDGQIYNAEEIRRRLETRGCKMRFHNDAEVALCWLRAEGKTGIPALNGSYTLAFWDGYARKLTLATDRFGFLPLYFVEADGILAFASEMKALLTLPFVSSDLDARAVSHCFTFGYLLNDESFYSQMQRLGPAGLLEFQGGRSELFRYWRPRYSPTRVQSLDDYAEQFTERLNQAVERQASKYQRVGALLSGGLDSRSIVASLHQLGHLQRTFTLTDGRSLEAVCASQVARDLSSTHEPVVITPELFVRRCRDWVARTEGTVSLFHNSIAALRGALVPTVDAVFDGITKLDGFFGFWHRWLPWGLNAPDPFPAFSEIVNLPYPAQPKASLLYYKRFFNRTFFETHLSGGLDRPALVKPLAWTRPDNRFDQIDVLDLVQRQRRFTTNGPNLLRHGVDVCTPYFDYAFFDFLLTVPVKLRGHGKPIVRRALQRTMPALAEVPVSTDGFPARHAGMRRVLLKVAQRAREKAMTFAGSDPQHGMHHGAVSFTTWLRESQTLQRFVLDNLVDHAQILAPYVDTHTIVQGAKEHFRGAADHTEMLGRALTFVLWHERTNELRETFTSPRQRRPIAPDES